MSTGTDPRVRKLAPVFAIGVFALVGLGMFITQRRGAEVGERMATLSVGELAEVRFYKDPIRDSEGLDVVVSDEQALSELAEALQSLEPVRLSLRALEVERETKIRLELEPEDSLLVRVMRSPEHGDTGIVTIDRVRGSGITPAGVYSSAAMLRWVEAMATQPGFESIAEDR